MNALKPQLDEKLAKKLEIRRKKLLHYSEIFKTYDHLINRNAKASVSKLKELL